MRIRFAPVVVTLALAMAASGCGRPATLAVDKAWVRLPAVPGRPAAAYFTIRGGAADVTLIRAETPSARNAALHESMAAGMRPLASVPVAAGATVAFAPGGRHVMLFDLDPRVMPGQPLTLSLVFADGRSLSTQARAVAASDPPPL